MGDDMAKASKRYQDYVIKGGRLIGDFDGMYRNSSEVPWHQDKTVNSVFSDHTVTLIRRLSPSSVLDVGCGLGYMLNRLMQEVTDIKKAVGLEISESAVMKARGMFPDIEFIVGTVHTHTHTHR